MVNELEGILHLMGVRLLTRGLRRNACALGIASCLLIALTGCGGGGTTAPPAPAVAITMGTPPTTLTVGQAFQFTATVTNTTKAAVTWAAGGVTGGNATVGTISSTGLYTAPAMVPTPTSVTIMAISQADTTKSASAAVGINVSLTLNLTSTSVQVTGTQ